MEYSKTPDFVVTPSYISTRCKLPKKKKQMIVMPFSHASRGDKSFRFCEPLAKFYFTIC